MQNIYSNIINFNKKSLSKIIKILRNNDLVALPTETVYGLAANAYSSLAIKRIYRIKNRPKKNPLIVHYFSLKQASKDIIFTKEFLILYKKFCPGPITFILNKKKSSKIKKEVSAGLSSVAIRFPSNQILREIMRNLDFPLAMPSANKSGKVSPTHIEHVIKDFDKKIEIVNGGRSKIGLESTVVDLTKKIKILRPGSILLEEIQKVLKKKIRVSKNTKILKSPGMTKSHYSPGIPIKLNVKKPLKNSAFIVIGKNYDSGKNIFNLSKKSDLNEAARNLYKTFIKIKNKNYKKISVMKIPNFGLGVAINDRLKKAANNGS